MQRLIDMPTLRKLVQMSESCIRRWIKLNLFPQSIPQGKHRKFWDQDEIDIWLKEKYQKIRAEMKLKHFGNGTRLRPVEEKKIESDLPW